MKVTQHFDASDLTYIKKASDNNYLVYLKLGKLLDIVLIQYTSSQSVQGLTRIADPGVDFFVNTVGNDTSDILEFIHSQRETRPIYT